LQAGFGDERDGLWPCVRTALLLARALAADAQVRTRPIQKRRERLGSVIASLDHVSVTAPPGALEQLGFRLTPTAGADDHSRVLLDRGYLEVLPPPGGETAIGGRGWFLRPADLMSSVSALRAHGIATSAPTVYEGRDGTWLDVELLARRPRRCCRSSRAGQTFRHGHRRCKRGIRIAP
jgi:hypothetical protein